MATNTALLGLIIGALPSISDKELTAKKLVSHFILLIIIIFSPQIPSLLLIILIALLDWADDDTWLVFPFYQCLVFFWNDLLTFCDIKLVSCQFQP